MSARGQPYKFVKLILDSDPVEIISADRRDEVATIITSQLKRAYRIVYFIFCLLSIGTTFIALARFRKSIEKLSRDQKIEVLAFLECVGGRTVTNAIGGTQKLARFAYLCIAAESLESSKYG